MKIEFLYLIYFISAKSAPQILYMRGECTFCFSNFLTVGLCNSFANSSFLETLPGLILVFLLVIEVFYQKNYKQLKQVHVDIHHISIFFATLNILSSNTLSAAVFLGKSLKSPKAISC